MTRALITDTGKDKEHYSNMFHTQNGTFQVGLSKLKVTTAFVHTE